MSKSGDPEEFDTEKFGFDKRLMLDLASGDLRLPALPDAVTRVRRTVTDTDSSEDDVVRVLGSDPVLAARVLRRANAAYYHGSVDPIGDLPTAVNRVGFDVILNITMLMGLEQLFPVVATDKFWQQLNTEWQQSVRVAALSQILAKRAPPLNVDTAFLAGLLHGIGRLYILLRSQDDPAWSDNDAEVQLIINERHAEIGHALIRHWELSEELAMIVLDHAACDPTKADEANLTVIVAMAVRLANQFDAADTGEAATNLTSACMDLDVAASLQVVSDARDEIAHLYPILGF